MNLKDLLLEMIAKQASDLHLRVGLKPMLRVDGELSSISTETLGPQEMNQVVDQILNPEQKSVFQQRNELDLALGVSKMGRFRVNFYRQRGTTGIAFRLVRSDIPSFEELNLPPILKELAERKRGLIIVTGTTGSGKSTTLASMIEHINQTRAENILTIEDPIEYVFRDKKSIVSQREVGGDTASFVSALRHAFRQDPDVVLIGELRDMETTEAALTISETGHLTFGTLHTSDCVQTINRIIDIFPSHQQTQIKTQLSFTLSAIAGAEASPGDWIPADANQGLELDREAAEEQQCLPS